MKNKLGHFVDVQHGFAFESEGFQDSGEFALLTAGNFHEAGGLRQLGVQQKFYGPAVDPKWVLAPGALLIAMTEQAAGLLGSAIRIPAKGKWLHNQRMGLVQIKRHAQICTDYLFHWFNSAPVRKSIFVAASGTKVRHSSPSQIHALEITLPDFQAQLRIAQTLDEWDRAIEKSNALLTALEQRKQGLMQQLLTGPRRLKGFKGKWKEVALDKVLERVTRKNANGCNTALTVSAQRGLVAQGSYFAKQIAAEVNEHYILLKRGEFAYNRSAANGYPFGAIKRLEAHDEGIVSTLCLCFGVRDTEVLDSDFLVWLIEAGQLNRAICRIAHEGARSHGLLNVTASDFFGIKASIPSFAEQRAIATILNDVKVEIEALQSQIEALKTQKCALMQKLLSGKWRMPKAALSRED
jgi:type I restriction enzyme, S subunit